MMIVDAIVRTRNIDNKIKRVEVYSPKFKFGTPIFILNEEFINRPVKLITGWSDIKIEIPVAINGGIIPDNQVGICQLTRGMFVTVFNDVNVYIVIPEVLIK